MRRRAMELRLRLLRELSKLDQSRARDVPGFVLVRLANIDQLDATVGDQLGDLLRGVVHSEEL